MDETGFLNAIESNPRDPAPRLIFADWLDEQGDPRGELLRIQEELRHPKVARRAAKEARMHELLNQDVEPLMITQTNCLGMEFVLIFPGEFMMEKNLGYPMEEAEHGFVQCEVTDPFYLSRTVVTQRIWSKVMGTAPWNDKIYSKNDADSPATFISWDEAIDFCTGLSRQSPIDAERWDYSLPTSIQWEYACRGGTTSKYSFGDDELLFGDYGWFEENAFHLGESFPHQVGTKKPNPWGLFDMHGNVCEWCGDVSNMIPAIGYESEVHYLVKGGSWGAGRNQCRSGYCSDRPHWTKGGGIRVMANVCEGL